MSMKLLSAPQGKSRRELENADQELRAQELDVLIVAKRKELNELDKQGLASLSEKATKNYEEEALWKQKIQGLTIEVEALESRRKSALVPLEVREKEVQDRDSALSRREELVTIQESENERTAELLQEKLDTVSEREEDATQYSIQLNNREFAIQFQEAQIRERMSALTEILKENIEEILQSQADIARRKALIKGRDISITEREKNVDLQEAAFANRERAIVDRYQTLQRAITETNLKQSGNH